ncbi:heparan-alpha-glucosaminide N-acetyltransferase isoform X2 [Setaria italica]|uniref:heparan-alpha-glucosaminide N-acetyltransferase isoform X2 n=1 Tax=Setaria italica TaxID=4555 RepID=UPI0006492425|nr:heparan-alpha-glucosaminide N-acetyltransferase isoform X2 [Setaria italica]
MILVDDGDGAYERIDHSPWNGCTLADFVMPFFLFIVGVAIAFALKVSMITESSQYQYRCCCDEDCPQNTENALLGCASPSSISSILSGTIGIHYGHVLIHFKTHKGRLKHWLLMGFSLLVLGILLHFTKAIPINKQLYSFSYVCFTGGAAGIVLSAFYILVHWIVKHVFVALTKERVPNIDHQVES